MQGVIFPAIRQYYNENKEFQMFVDSINTALLHSIIDKICDDTKKHTGKSFDRVFLKSLFGEDYCAFLQNFIQAPRWHSNECTPKLIEEFYKLHGFTNVRRVNKFVERTDVRKFFAPLHYDINHPFSKILYGEGCVLYIGQKA